MQTKITARRGLSDQFPENTLLALRKALEHGADRLEMDLHPTSDGRLILHHMYALGETDDGEGLIYLKDSLYLRSLDAGSWMGPQFAGKRMPFLEEVFAELGERTEYELDLKGFTLDFLQGVLSAIDAFGLMERVELTSAFLPLLSHARRLRPETRVGMFADYLLSAWMPPALKHTVIRENARLGGIDVVHCPLDVLTEDFIAALWEDGRSIHASNCETREELERAFRLGVDQLSTQRVDLAIQVRDLLDAE